MKCSVIAVFTWKTYRGVFGSGDTGWDSHERTSVFEAESVEEVVSKARAELRKDETISHLFVIDREISL